MKTELDRRGFLKASAQGVAVAGLAGIVQHFHLSELLRPTLRRNSIPLLRLLLSFKLHGQFCVELTALEAKEKAWDEPLVGFSRGEDPLYQLYKDNSRPVSLDPSGNLPAWLFPELSAKPDELTVVSWILPATEAVKADLRKQTKNPAEQWVRARIYGEVFNEELRKYVAET